MFFVAAGMNLYFLPLASGTGLSTYHVIFATTPPHLKCEDKPHMGLCKGF